MKKLITTLSLIIVMAGCSSEDGSTTSERMQKAGEQAKEMAKNAGEAISDTATKAKDKWEEANVGRFEADPTEDSIQPQTSVDPQELKDALSTAKDKVIGKGGEVVDEVKDVTTKQTD